MGGDGTPESRLLSLIRQIQFGTLRIEVRNGVPVSFRTEIEGHLTKPLLSSQLQLVDAHQQAAD